MLGVDKKWVRPLPMNVATIIPDTGGVQVTLIEANHCELSARAPPSFDVHVFTGPGSCLFLFEGKQTVDAGDSAYKSQYVGSAKVFRYLHCGDFRACPQHVLHPAVKGKRIDHVYLDTTYLDPKVRKPGYIPDQPFMCYASTVSLPSHWSFLRAPIWLNVSSDVPLLTRRARAKQNLVA